MKCGMMPNLSDQTKRASHPWLVEVPLCSPGPATGNPVQTKIGLTHSVSPFLKGITFGQRYCLPIYDCEEQIECR